MLRRHKLIVQGEVTAVLSALRGGGGGGGRWIGMGRSNSEEIQDPLIHDLCLLQDNLLHTQEIGVLDIVRPFCSVVINEETTGPITGLAIGALDKFLASGLLDPSYDKAAHGICEVAEAVTHARFVGTSTASDEVVLMKILKILNTLLSVPGGRLLTNESVCEIMQSCFRICFEGRLSGQGIVEVYCHGKWGVVCSDSDSDNFALTVCNQLGYNSLSKYDYDTEFSNTVFASMQETDCGGSDFKKCVKDCASCDDNIDSCDYILSVTCQHDIGTSKPANKMGVCTPKGISMMNSGQVAVAALVLILFLYVYFITRVCIRIISICCRRRRGQPLLEGNVNNENNNNNNNKCRRIICDILCCN